MAWRRVWGRILRDPFTWTALALIVYLVIPLFNVGLSPTPQGPTSIRLSPICLSASRRVNIWAWSAGLCPFCFRLWESATR